MKIAIIILISILGAAGVLGILMVIGAGKLCRKPVDLKYKEDKDEKTSYDSANQN